MCTARLKAIRFFVPQTLAMALCFCRRRSFYCADKTMTHCSITFYQIGALLLPDIILWRPGKIKAGRAYREYMDFPWKRRVCVKTAVSTQKRT